MAAIDNTTALERWEDDMELNCLDIPIELLERMLELAPAARISSPAGQFFVGLLCGRLLERGQIHPEFI